MIPKIIHYCWFGKNELPEMAKKCISSWKKFLPDYQIIEWNEDNFDIKIVPYTLEAYKLKKYAFVSDFVRFWVLYNYGGIYFDTDVEIIKNIDDIIKEGPFMGFECQEGVITDNPNGNVAAGLGIGAIPKMPFIKKVLNYYIKDHYISWNGNSTGNIVAKLTNMLDYNAEKRDYEGKVFMNGFLIYPIDYFCPLNYYTGELKITTNTRTVHHYMASWTHSQTSLIKRIHRRLSYIYTKINVRLFYTFPDLEL